MAIDTEEKRRSTLGVLAIVRILPVPDPGVDAAERMAVWLYSGIAAGGGGGGGGGRTKKLISVGIYEAKIGELD